MQSPSVAIVISFATRIIISKFIKNRMQ